ncbi:MULTISPECIES: hypothetical protein [Sphingomonas]|uniref:hypothetical protein n=1 Tax=Sphingomonas TaxID=13687 RepID=UPI002550FC6A|nr:MULTISPECIES: hypothetical protein [Sphingomonas]MDK8186741.1 hypothetical protein [Sphingomonas zeae]MDK8216405.1 hypothetical protein [Sphingomonas sp. UMB7805-LC452B]
MTSEVATLRGEPQSVRVRLLGPAAPGALHWGYDIWSPADFWLSAFRDDYLRGAVKGVVVSIPAKHAQAFESFCIVPVQIAERAAYAARHRQALLEQIQHQFKAAVVRAATGGDRKRARRERHRINKALGDVAPSIGAIETMFSDRPDALAYAQPLREIWQQVADRGGQS